MFRNSLVVAALLLMGMSTTAEAADQQSERSENARKAMILLGAIGVNSNDAKALVEDLDARIEDQSVNFAKERIGSGTLKFHYKLGNGVSKDNLELQYAPDDSNWKATASPEAAMVHYKYTF